MKTKLKCFYCKKLGHMVKDCRVKIVDERKVKGREAQGNVMSQKQQMFLLQQLLNNKKIFGT